MKNITKLLVLVVAVMSVMLAFASCGCSHEEKVIPAKEATCSEAGATEGKECTKCGEILVAPEEIPMIAHTPANAPKTEPTCTEDGHEAGTKCSVCDAVLSGMAKIPAAHKPVDVEAKEATCVLEGNTAGTKCSVCQKILTGVVTIPTNDNHNIREVEAKEPTCLEAGSTAGRYCTTNGCSFQEGMEVREALGHTLENVGSALPTCTEAGHEAGTICTREGCGHVETGYAPIPALGHDVTTWTMNITPALGVEGNKTGACNVCKETVTVVYAAFEGYTFDGEGVTAPTTTAEHVIASLVDRDAGKAVKITTTRAPGSQPGTAWLSAFGFTKTETAPKSITVSYDVMVPTNDANNNGVNNEYVGDFFTSKGNPRLDKAVVNTGKDTFYSQVRIGSSQSADPYASGHDTPVDMWYLSLTTNGQNTDEVNVFRPDGTNFALDTWYNISLEIDFVTGNVWVYVDGVLSLEMYSNANVGSKAEKSAFTHAGYFDGAVSLKIGDFMRTIGHICYDNITFAPYTLDHEGQHNIVAVPETAPTCAAAGHTAGYKCTHCDLVFSGCEPITAAHTPGENVEVTTAPQAGIPGKGNTVCAVCGTTYECEIPALPGFNADYEDGALPTPYQNNASVTMTAEKEGENTVAHFSATKTNFESLFYWDSNGMTGPVAGEYLVMSTKIKFGDITVVNGYSSWAWNFGFTPHVGTNADDRLGPGNYTLVLDDAATGAAHMKLTMGQNTHEFLKDQWYELTYVYSVYTNADGATVGKLAVYIDGVLLGTSAEGAVSANVADGVAAIEFKTKNLNNFTAYNIYFDDTTLYKTTEAPVFETPEVPAE